jgi:type IV secretion system protein VirD4
MLTDSYGSARWANEDDLRRENFSFFCGRPTQTATENNCAYHFLLGALADPKFLLQNIQENYEPALGSLFDGITKIFGQTSSPVAASPKRYFGWQGNGHILSVAPTRAGKGVGIVIPNLLNYKGSVIVIDPKGENYAITAGYRRDVMGQQIVKLDPFNICEGRSSVVNPLCTINIENDDLIDEVITIADTLVIREKGEKDPHWNDKARSLIKTLLLAVLCEMGNSKRKNLGEMRRLLEVPMNDFFALMEKISAKTDIAGGLLARAGNEILGMGKNEELYGVISTASRHTEFLDSPRAMSSLSDERSNDRGDYFMRKLKSEGNVSIYIIMPPHLISRYSRLMRLWISSAMTAMTKTLGKSKDGAPVLFMLDEMAQLGRMEQLIQAASLQAGYGVSMWMIWQDIGQLKSLYEKEWSSFLANARIQQYFGVNDPETAKYVSEMLGTATIKIESSSSQRGKSGKMTEVFHQTSTNESRDIREKERKLLMVDELRRLDRRTLITFIQGCPPLLAEKMEYFSDDNFKTIAAPNPYM